MISEKDFTEGINAITEYNNAPVICDGNKLSIGSLKIPKFTTQEQPVFVYLVSDLDNTSDPKTKIGRSINPLTRSNGIISQSGNRDLIMYAYMECVDGVNSEMKFHDLFKDFRIPKTEWFKLSASDVLHNILIHESLASLIKNVNILRQGSRTEYIHFEV